MDKFDEMSTSEYKKYEESILNGEIALSEDIDFVLESDSNFVICKDGSKKVNPNSEFKTYLKANHNVKRNNKTKTNMFCFKRN